MLLCFITISLVLIADATRTPLFAAEDDSIGYIADNGEEIDLSGNIIQPIGSYHALYAKSGGKITMNGSSLTIAANHPNYNAAHAVQGTIILNDVKIDILSARGAGLFASENTASINMTEGSIYTKLEGAFGAYSTRGASITLTDVGIDTRAGGSHGLVADRDDSKITMSGGSITTYSDFYPVGDHSESDIEGAHGANVRNRGASITLSNVNITTYGIIGGGSYGLNATGGTIVMTGGGVHTWGQYSYGLRAWDGGQIDAENITVKTETNQSHAVYASYNMYGNVGVVNLTDTAITTAGNEAAGLKADSEAEINMSGGRVHTLGYSSHGLAASLGGKIDAKNITVKTESGRSHAVYASYSDPFGYSDVSIVNLTDIDITTVGIEAAGLKTEGKAGINVSGGSVATSGIEAYGAWCLDDDSRIYLQNVGIQTTGSLADAVQVSKGGYLSMDTSAISATAADAYAIRAYGTNASSISAVYGDASVFTIDGNIAAQDYSLIDMQMNNGSTFTGLTELGAANADLLMAISGANSVWHVTGNSVLTDLTLIDSSVDYRNSVLGTAITVSNLNASAHSDGGYLTMKTDIANENADLLKVTGTTDGDHTIRVANVGSAATDGSEVTLLVDTADQTGNFSLYGNGVSLGGWYYELRQNTADYGAGAGWELYATGASPGGEGGVNTFIANYLLGYAETQTLLQRLGDLRDTPKQSGLWFRLHGGKFVSNAKSYVNPFDFKYYGVQVGYDRKVAIGWEGDSYLGVMFGYSDSDLDYLNNGSGSVDSKTIALYWTTIKPGGFYLDAVIKYVWMENDYSVLDSEGAIERGNGVKTNGFGASLEFGERWHFARDVRKGLYIEPQVQLSYQRQSGGHFMTSGGLEIGVRPYNSLIGRLGILVGYDNLDSNFYLKVSREREFLGDLTVVANGVEFKERMKGSWWVYGLGYTAKVNERNSFYLDLERTSGGHFTKEWAAKAGWRTMF